jgi:hypothetical protein
VGNRHWPYDSHDSYDPYDPYARQRRRDDDGGWVVAGEEPAPYYGRPATPPHESGDWPEPWADRYPPQRQAYQAPGDQYGGGYDPPQPRYARPAYPARQPAPLPPRLPARQPPPDDPPDDEPRPALAPALTWTIAAYLLPILLYLAWAFTRSGTAPAGCVDASGAPCQAPRVEAAENLLGVLPAIVGALVLALLIALGLRRMATGWRAGSIGLAAAVIGGGVATVVAAGLG